MENLDGNGTINQTNAKGPAFNELVLYTLPSAVAAPPFALPSNALILRLLLGKPGVCSTSEIFIVNLAAFGVLFCFISVAEYIRLLCLRSAEAATFAALSLLQTGVPLFLCLLSLDGYLAVCRPLVFLRLKDPKLRSSLCLMVNATTAACCCLTKVHMVLKWRVTLAILCCATVIISTCNVLILRSLRQTGPSSKGVHPVKKRAFKQVLTLSVLFNVYFLPVAVEHALGCFWPSRFKPLSVLSFVANTLLASGTFLQPLSYLAHTKQLPELRCHRRRCRPAAETKAVATV